LAVDKSQWPYQDSLLKLMHHPLHQSSCLLCPLQGKEAKLIATWVGIKHMPMSVTEFVKDQLKLDKIVAVLGRQQAKPTLNFSWQSLLLVNDGAVVVLVDAWNRELIEHFP
jgi:hypothetical protein